MKQPVYYRLCHVCHEVTDSKEPIHRCKHCDKPLASFQYFDDHLTPVQGDTSLRPKYLDSEYEPVRGFTAYWDT